MLVSTPMCGRAICTSSAMSPSWRAPISTTTTRAPVRLESSSLLTPISLFSFAGEASTCSAVVRARAIARAMLGGRFARASRNADDVPGETRRERRRRSPCTRVSCPATTSAGIPSEAHVGIVDDEAAAPLETASPTYACPSKRSPRSARNVSPAPIVRVSVTDAQFSRKAFARRKPERRFCRSAWSEAYAHGCTASRCASASRAMARSSNGSTASATI